MKEINEWKKLWMSEMNESKWMNERNDEWVKWMNKNELMNKMNEENEYECLNEMNES